jgi:hypothetical protein
VTGARAGLEVIHLAVAGSFGQSAVPCVISFVLGSICLGKVIHTRRTFEQKVREYPDAEEMTHALRWGMRWMFVIAAGMFLSACFVWIDQRFAGAFFFLPIVLALGTAFAPPPFDVRKSRQTNFPRASSSKKE